MTNTLPPPSSTDTQLCRHIFTSSPRTQSTVTLTRERLECDSCLDDASPSSGVISNKRSSTPIPPQRRLLWRCRRACEFPPLLLSTDDGRYLCCLSAWLHIHCWRQYHLLQQPLLSSLHGQDGRFITLQMELRLSGTNWPIPLKLL